MCRHAHSTAEGKDAGRVYRHSTTQSILSYNLAGADLLTQPIGTANCKESDLHKLALHMVALHMLPLHMLHDLLQR